jgi:hypothetical protein
LRFAPGFCFPLSAGWKAAEQRQGYLPLFARPKPPLDILVFGGTSASLHFEAGAKKTRLAGEAARKAYASSFAFT